MKMGVMDLSDWIGGTAKGAGFLPRMRIGGLEKGDSRNWRIYHMKGGTIWGDVLCFFAAIIFGGGGKEVPKIR